MVKITPTVPFNYRSDQGEHDRLDRMLDMALDLTFPGSHPVAITISTNENRKMQAWPGWRSGPDHRCRWLPFGDLTVPTQMLQFILEQPEALRRLLITGLKGEALVAAFRAHALPNALSGLQEIELSRVWRFLPSCS